MPWPFSMERSQFVEPEHPDEIDMHPSARGCKLTRYTPRTLKEIVRSDEMAYQRFKFEGRRASHDVEMNPAPGLKESFWIGHPSALRIVTDRCAHSPRKDPRLHRD